MLKFLQATNLTWSDSTATSVFENCPVIHCGYSFSKYRVEDQRGRSVRNENYMIIFNKYVYVLKTNTNIVNSSLKIKKKYCEFSCNYGIILVITF